MFADDATISMVIPNMKSRGSVAHCINSDLKEIESWADNWIVKFNAKKTQLLEISCKVAKDDLKVSFLNETIRSTDCIKLLGVHITKTLD